MSSNAHMLDALRCCEPREAQPRIEKIVKFLNRSRHPAGFWVDKWHVSSYYATCVVILAAAEIAPDLVAPAISWLAHTQRDDGGWGYYGTTDEETAYSVLALRVWRRAGQALPGGVLERGVELLRKRFVPDRRDFPPLWIGKALYSVVQVTQAAVLAALAEDG